jgi:hypothetical protein
MKQYEKVMKVIYDDANKLGLKFFGMCYLYDPSENTKEVIKHATKKEIAELKRLKIRAMPVAENDDVFMACMNTDLDISDARTISQIVYDNVLYKFNPHHSSNEE